MEEKTLEHGQGERTIGIALFPIFSIPDRDTSLFQRHHFIWPFSTLRCQNTIYDVGDIQSHFSHAHFGHSAISHWTCYHL